ncbi:MAG TPA: hypothetical protein VKT49_19260 [Bryobacteraceae bacterium]|nr:hypothetical protein [Bryobacteraceae bacterium]
MRAVSSSIMAALVVVALFWGNCFSCPEAVLAFATHQPAHQCCHKTKAAVPGCDTQNLGQFVKADAGTHVPAMPVRALGTVLVPVLLGDRPAPVLIEYPPPDLLSLLSVHRV